MPGNFLPKRWFVYSSQDRPFDQLVKIRNVDNPKLFLSPPYPDPSTIFERVGLDPQAFSAAIFLIEEARKNNVPIIIHGDYDVDGVCATAILWETLYFGLKYQNVFPFIPNRFEHGYGISLQTMREICGNYDKPLIITVDCGITGAEAVNFLHEHGAKIIITDHHTPPENPPTPDVLIHTPNLTGSGIAWVMASILGYGEETLDLATIGTIADIQSLTGVNRDIVYHGLKKLESSSRVGFNALRNVASLQDRTITPGVIGWWIAPRLNAAGRLDSAFDALRLLTTRNKDKAYERAVNLNTLNIRRQEMTEEAINEARGQLNDDLVQMVVSENWNEGILGLIAGRLKEEKYRPVIALTSIDSDVLKGSARSIENYNIIEALRSNSQYLTDVGGHPMAAGLTMNKNNFNNLRQALNEDASSRLDEESLKPKVVCDLEIKLQDISIDLVRELNKLEPHGVGNPTPLFLIKNCALENPVWFGSTQDHLRVNLMQEDGIIKAVWFRAPKMDLRGKFHLACELEIDHYYGENEIRLLIKEITPESTPITEITLQ